MADGSLTPTRSKNGERVYNFATAKAAATVVDAVLNYPTMASRLLYKGKKFSGDGRKEESTIIKDVKITNRTQFQWFDGLDPLNSSAENVVIQLQFNDAHASMPMVEIMTDAFARDNDSQDVDYSAFLKEDTLNEMVEGMSQALYSTAGASDQPLSLEEVVDNGTNLSTYGGQSRSTYTPLQATVNATGGTMTLGRLATLRSTISDTGPKERPTCIVTTDTIADFYEQFLTPTVRNEYKSLSMGGKYPTAQEAPSMGQGFGGINTYSGIPIIRDKAATSGVLYMLNEDYLHWSGRTKVPSSFKEFVKPVKMGKAKVVEGQASQMPSKYHGFFYQAKKIMDNQAGIISRFYLFGQLWSPQPRRQGKLTGITGVA